MNPSCDQSCYNVGERVVLFCPMRYLWEPQCVKKCGHRLTSRSQPNTEGNQPLLRQRVTLTCQNYCCQTVLSWSGETSFLFVWYQALLCDMHRAYQPITPANNKLLKQRWDMSRYDTHRRKVSEWNTNNTGGTSDVNFVLSTIIVVFQVQSAKAVIDNKPPQTYMHLHLKLKKLQVREIFDRRIHFDLHSCEITAASMC